MEFEDVGRGESEDVKAWSLRMLGMDCEDAWRWIMYIYVPCLE